MRYKRTSQDQNPKPGGAALSAAAASLSQDEIYFVRSRCEVVRRACFSYMNEGSPQGREVQHWLEAEAQLITERTRTGVHGYHNRS